MPLPLQIRNAPSVSGDDDGDRRATPSPRSCSRSLHAIAVTLACAVSVSCASLGGRGPERVSVGGTGSEGDLASLRVAVSGDGRYVAFTSFASNLLSPIDADSVARTRSKPQLLRSAREGIYLRDRKSGATELILRAHEPGQYFSALTISRDGRLLGFSTNTPFLVPGDRNEHADVYVYDRQTENLECVSVGASGAPGDGPSHGPSLSADGRFVAFVSRASDLVPGDSNGTVDVFVRDRVREQTRRVSVSSTGEEGREPDRDASETGRRREFWTMPQISSDGRFVAFSSRAANLVPGDENRAIDSFVHDSVRGTTERVSVSSSGAQADRGSHEAAALSADGRFVAFSSDASNLVEGDTNGAADVFIRDRESRTTVRVSLTHRGDQAAGASFRPVLSDDGTRIAFLSFAGDLLPGDDNDQADIFVRDLERTSIWRASSGRFGAAGDGQSIRPALSADGRVVGFSSEAANLVRSDTNSSFDIFVR